MSSPSYYPFFAVVASPPTYVTDKVDKSIVDAFTCSICLDMLSNDAVHNEGCEHYQCIGCRQRCENRGQCPVCRNESLLVPLRCKLALDVIETFPVVCPWPACGEQMKRSERNRHANACEHRQFRCMACDTYGTIAVLRDHVMHTCEFMCSRGAFRCTQRMSHHLLADHETACKMSQDEHQRSALTLKRERDQDADLRGDDANEDEEEVQEFQPPTARLRVDPQPRDFRTADDYLAHMCFIASEAKREERLRQLEAIRLYQLPVQSQMATRDADAFPNPRWASAAEWNAYVRRATAVRDTRLSLNGVNTWIPPYHLNGELIQGHLLANADPTRSRTEYDAFIRQARVHRPPPQENIRRSLNGPTIIPRPSWLINASEQAQLFGTNAHLFNAFQ